MLVSVHDPPGSISPGRGFLPGTDSGNAHPAIGIAGSGGRVTVSMNDTPVDKMLKQQ